jgi:zinc protease
MNLRQDKGYSYGYYSSLDWGSQVSAVLAGGAVETSVTKESVIETLKEFSDVRGDRPVTQEEYDDSRDGISRGFPAQFETHGQIMTRLVQVALFRLPDDYYVDFLGNIAAVGLEQLREIASRRVDDKRLAVLVVGDRSAVEPGLREVGLPVVPVDYDGRRVE